MLGGWGAVEASESEKVVERRSRISLGKEALVGENKKVGTQAEANLPASLTNQPDTEVDMAPSHSKRSPAFQLYPAEFLGSHNVIKMGMTERGCYITLLCRCWLNNGLPTDMAELADYCDMKPDRFERIWKNSRLGRCFVERDGKYHNERLDLERKKQSEYKRRQSDAAKERWEKSKGNASAYRGIATQSRGKASSSLNSFGSVSSRSNKEQGGKPDPHGHFPPCKTHQECIAKRLGKVSA
jgi:uncharacterized protein YdaU (DUF1376 family)